MNNIVVVGRLVSTPLKKEEFTTFKLATTRSYKNSEGCYETDFIRIRVSNNIGNNIIEYVRRGDLIAIKGTLESEKNIMYVLGDRVSFLSSSRNGVDN